MHTRTYVLTTPKGARERDGGFRLRINLILRKYLQSKCASFGIPSLWVIRLRNYRCSTKKFVCVCVQLPHDTWCQIFTVFSWLKKTKADELRKKTWWTIYIPLKRILFSRSALLWQRAIKLCNGCPKDSRASVPRDFQSLKRDRPDLTLMLVLFIGDMDKMVSRGYVQHIFFSYSIVLSLWEPRRSPMNFNERQYTFLIARTIPYGGEPPFPPKK